MELKEIQTATDEFIGKLRTETTNTYVKAEKEVQSLVGFLVERGKVTQVEGQRLFNDLNTRVRARRSEIEKRVETGSRWALDRLNIPTKSEVEQLSSRVNNLSRKVANLRKQLSV